MKKDKQPINYIILTTPRTGSTMLCNILENLGLLSSVYNSNNDYELEFKPKENILRDIKPDIFFSELLDKNRINNISGFKFMIKHLEIYGENASYDLGYLLKSFPIGTKFIYLTRKNKIRQAVSFLKAKEDKKWISFKDNNTLNKTEYNITNKEIDYFIRQENKIDYRIKNVFRENNINSLEIHYEDLVDNKKSTIKKILNYLNIEIKTSKIKTDLKKQSNDITEEIVGKYNGVFIKNGWRRKFYFLKIDTLDFTKKLLNKFIYFISRKK